MTMPKSAAQPTGASAPGSPDHQQQVTSSPGKQATTGGARFTLQALASLGQAGRPFLSILPGGGGAAAGPNSSPATLKHSASTSCLPSLTASEPLSSSGLVAGTRLASADNRKQSSFKKKGHTIRDDAATVDSGSQSSDAFTRASMTHDWKRLKTPNKCRECNFLAYFNSRECQLCGLVAHKKCLKVLVIKCGAGAGAYRPAASSAADLSQLVGWPDGPTTLTTPDSPAATAAAAAAAPSSSSADEPGVKLARRLATRPIFGQPVDTDGPKVIDFIRRFVYEIDARGLHSRGIYRVSSIKSKVDRLCNYYDQNLSSLVDLSSFHPNIIANALKMYLRLLPEPLLTNEHYREFIELAKRYSTSRLPLNKPDPTFLNPTKTSASAGASAGGGNNNNNNNNNNSSISDYSSTSSSSSSTSGSSSCCYCISASTNSSQVPEALIEELRHLIQRLPATNRELVGIIMRHLQRVAHNANENQMTASNLSIIFGPTLLAVNDNKSQAIADNIHQARIVELMITWAHLVFPSSEPDEQQYHHRQEATRDDHHHHQRQHHLDYPRTAVMKDNNLIEINVSQAD